MASHTKNTVNTFLNLILQVNSVTQEKLKDAYAFHVHDTLLGYIRPDIPNILNNYPNVFFINHQEKNVVLNPELHDFDSRSKAITTVLQDLRIKKVFGCLQGWRNEAFPVFGSPRDGILFEIERSGVGLFGLRASGCHLNGYTIRNGVIYMWIAKRSLSKPTYPGRLDNMVGGGLPMGMDPFDNIIKECQEEAGLSREFTLERIKSVGAISFYLDCERGWMPDIEYVYDLQVSIDFQPQPVDGEVHSFTLLNLKEIKDLLLRNEFTPEASLVIIDFFIRHGEITPSNELDYLKILSLLHRELPFPPPRYSSTSSYE